jgi:hypothetical protein
MAQTYIKFMFRRREGFKITSFLRRGRKTRDVLMRRIRKALLLAFLFIFVPPAGAQEPLRLQEQKIKAGLIYNFIKHASWPGGDSGEILICLLGGDPLDGYLYPLEGRTAQQRRIEIREIESADDAKGCDFLFVDTNQSRNLDAALAMLRGKPVLTASDMAGFAGRGGMIEFTRENRRIGILINRQALEAAGISVDNRLLKVARLLPPESKGD